MNNFSRPEALLDRARLDAVIGPVVRAHGGEVVDIEWKQEPGGWVLRVFVEKLGSAASNASTESSGVSLERVPGSRATSRPPSTWQTSFRTGTTSRCSSPGVERPLRDARDYARFVGKKAKVRVRDLVDGQKVVLGVIEECAGAGEEPRVALREGAQLRVIPLSNVVSARLVFEFGPPPRPGKAPGKGKAAKRASRLAT